MPTIYRLSVIQHVQGGKVIKPIFSRDFNCLMRLGEMISVTGQIAFQLDEYDDARCGEDFGKDATWCQYGPPAPLCGEECLVSDVLRGVTIGSTCENDGS